MTKVKHRAAKLQAVTAQREELNTTTTVYVIGLDYDVKDAIHWTDAVTGILAGTHTPFKVHPTRRVRSAGRSVDMPWPIIVRLNFWHDVPFRRPVHLDGVATRLDILRRDGWTCAYCAGYATTIDHVFPESRGGKTTWGNLVAACTRCNGDKDNMTPEEAGMKLLWNPRAQDLKYAGVQAEVWRILSEQELSA